MNAAEWHILDNLQQNWPYRTNLHPIMADEALVSCISKGWVADGKITMEGRGALLIGNTFRFKGGETREMPK